MRYVSSEKPALCPHCGAAKVVPIAYGDPIGPFVLSDDTPVFGGCCRDINSPSWACRGCGTNIHRTPLREAPYARR